jgi:hypothetical protein
VELAPHRGNGHQSNSDLHVGFGGADRVVICHGVMMATTHTVDCRSRHFAHFSILVMAELVTRATLDKVGFVATVDVLDPSPIHIHTLLCCLVSQGAILINKGKYDHARSTMNSFGVDLEVGRNRHQSAGEQRVRIQFSG